MNFYFRIWDLRGVRTDMHNIEWKPELSVGIGKIDDDHKQLISLTNRLINAIDNEIPKKEILDIFEELEAYTHYHFEREEAFMDRHCTSNDMREQIVKHKEQHSYFTGKLSVLKETLMQATAKYVSYEIVEFLLHWLIDHIIKEDLKLTQCLKTDRKSEHSWMQRISDSLRKKTSLHQRLWFILALPLIFFVLQSLFISYNAYTRYSELQNVQKITQSVININNVITQLQRERGLSSAYISSGYRHFQKELQQQRQQTDRIILQSLKSKAMLQEHIQIEKGLHALKKLKQIRAKIDTQQISREACLSYYTNFIETLITVIKDISYLPFNSIDRNTYAPMLLLLHINEINGLIRYEGLTCLEIKDSPRERFISLLSTKEDYHKVFDLLAPEQLKEAVAKIDLSENSLQLRQIQEQILAGTIYGNEAAQEWFSITSLNIGQYKTIIDQTLQQIGRDAYLEKKHFSTQLVVSMIIFVLILLFIGVSIYLFKESILRPIDTLTKALHKLSAGDKSIYFTTVNKKDTIGKMEHAYNHLRRSLLKADYADILMELQELKTQKYEKLSAEDPLTGIFNRRAFMYALEREILQAQKSKKPLSLLVLDIDRFKQINDTFGHETGDLILQHFVQRIKELIRENDILARIGGEEFALLLPNTSAEGARTLAEKIINEIAELDLHTIAPGLQMTVSIGIAVYRKNISAKTLLREADEHLYEAKHAGRNRFCG